MIRSIFVFFFTSLMSFQSVALDPLQVKSSQDEQMGPAGIPKERQLPPSRPETKTSSSLIEYTMPGVITFQEGKWVGAPQLNRLPNRIPIMVEMTQFAEDKIDVTDRDILRSASGTFQEMGFSPEFAQDQGSEDEGGLELESAGITMPLPYFQLQILLYPTGDGYVASLSGRLFEQVHLPRIRLGGGYYFQAITWEKDVLIALPRRKGKEILLHQIDAIVKEFLQAAQQANAPKNGE